LLAAAVAVVTPFDMLAHCTAGDDQRQLCAVDIRELCGPLMQVRALSRAATRS